MNRIIELREKRAKLWEDTKAFLDERRKDDGMLSAEDTGTYERMEADVVNLGKEIDRLERQSVLDLELSKATTNAITNIPNGKLDSSKTGIASNEYREAFWNNIKKKEISNALQVGTDSEGGYLAPDEFEKTLIESLEEQNIFRQIANVINTSSGDKKIHTRLLKLC